MGKNTHFHERTFTRLVHPKKEKCDHMYICCVSMWIKTSIPINIIKIIVELQGVDYTKSFNYCKNHLKYIFPRVGSYKRPRPKLYACIEVVSSILEWDSQWWLSLLENYNLLLFTDSVVIKIFKRCLWHSCVAQKGFNFISHSWSSYKYRTTWMARYKYRTMWKYVQVWASHMNS